MPRPRLHLIRLHGVVAVLVPNAKLRALVVPQGPPEDEEEDGASVAAAGQCEVEIAQAGRTASAGRSCSNACLTSTCGTAPTSGNLGHRRPVPSSFWAVWRTFETPILPKSRSESNIARGEIDTGNDPDVTAVILLGAMRGVMLQRLDDDCIKLAAKRDRLLQIVERVMRVRSA